MKLQTTRKLNISLLQKAVGIFLDSKSREKSLQLKAFRSIFPMKIHLSLDKVEGNDRRHLNCIVTFCARRNCLICVMRNIEQFVLYPYNGNEDALTQRDYLEREQVGVVRKKATRRTLGNKVVRINSVPIRSGKVFYLRTLLIHHAATSYRDLHTIEGITFSSFHEAACDFGLFENQNEGHLALQEAVDHLRTPAQLRFLFVQVLLEGYAAMPLWTEFRDSIAADHILRLGNNVSGYDHTADHRRPFIPLWQTSHRLWITDGTTEIIGSIQQRTIFAEKSSSVSC